MLEKIDFFLKKLRALNPHIPWFPYKDIVFVRLLHPIMPVDIHHAVFYAVFIKRVRKPWAPVAGEPVHLFLDELHRVGNGVLVFVA